MKKYSELSEDEKENRRLEFFQASILVISPIITVLISSVFDVDIFILLASLPLSLLVLKYYSFYRYGKFIRFRPRLYGIARWSDWLIIEKTDSKRGMIFFTIFYLCLTTISLYFGFS